MRSSFHPRLINDPFSDPGLFIPVAYERRALMFDLGELSGLPARDLLKVSHVFVTHTHMDHFIGFDTLLRVLLGRDKEIHIFGPSSFMEKVEAKLSAYTWNLVENYENNLSINVIEIHRERAFKQRYESRNQFEASGEPQEQAFTGNLVSEQSFSIDAVLLDHKVDCIALALKENFSVNIVKEGLEKLQLPVGPWLSEFKRAIYAQCDPDKPFRVFWKKRGEEAAERYIRFGELKERIAKISPGKKITYITDIIGSPENIAKAVDLASQSHHLFIEAAFLDEEREMARKKYHLTAREAGLIAAKAGVKQLTLFHFSPRYFGREKELYEEAMAAFRSGA
jgi:ribonuclease Z